MLPQRSIRAEYAKQLVFASLTLIAVFSLILYGYIKTSIYDEIKEGLIEEAKFISLSNTNYENLTEVKAFSVTAFRAGEHSISVIPNQNYGGKIHFREFKRDDKQFLELYYPYRLENKSYIRISKDVSDTQHLLAKILNSILILNFAALVLVQIYAFVLSNILSRPVKVLSNKLCKMNENVLQPIKTDNMPLEFIPLGESLNSLIERIQKYVEYQKELFIGIAHELKTPLAVMKLKNEVLLIKKRDCENYMDGIKLNIENINEMNHMISTLLEIGRQEGAQFESPKEMDVIAFLKTMADDFQLLGAKDQKRLVAELSPDKLVLSIQPTLFHQIVQNFLQNAMKFTPANKTVTMRSRIKDNYYILEVIDEGPGIDGNIDIYAPFKRSGNKSGAGLGLFLAKSAAASLGADISITNREDQQGAVAAIKLDLKKLRVKDSTAPKLHPFQKG